MKSFLIISLLKIAAYFTVFTHIIAFSITLNLTFTSTSSPVHLAFNVFESSSGSDESLSPVIFLHGLTSVKESWKDIPQIIAEKTKRKTYAYDARNHGDSGYSDDFTFDLNVEDLFHFMDTINAPKAILIGHSMGGITATHAALKKPERVEKVFSEDMHISKFTQESLNVDLPLMKLRLESLKHLPTGVDVEEAIKLSNDYIISKIPCDSPLYKFKDELRKFKPWLKKKSNGGFEWNCNARVIIRALTNVDLLMSEPRGRYDGNAYFIYANKSIVSVGTKKENIRKHFPKAQFIPFETRSHNLHDDFEKEFIDAVLKGLQ